MISYGIRDDSPDNGCTMRAETVGKERYDRSRLQNEAMLTFDEARVLLTPDQIYSDLPRNWKLLPVTYTVSCEAVKKSGRSGDYREKYEDLVPTEMRIAIRDVPYCCGMLQAAAHQWIKESEPVRDGYMLKSAKRPAAKRPEGKTYSDDRASAVIDDIDDLSKTIKERGQDILPHPFRFSRAGPKTETLRHSLAVRNVG